MASSLKTKKDTKYEDTTLKCPSCDSQSLTYNKKKGIWECRCGYTEERE